ncbi:MAG: MBL fold metallo-hydrolase [Candidatus Sungbacteria bacterium]|nr:MBL fold metallo-hydrolase [Candidatus Sungbacteria bacterium]
MSRFKKQLHWYVLALLFCAVVLIWTAVFSIEARSDALTVHIFDIGQGDGIFIETVSGTQMLIDGGPDSSILSKLGRAMPFWDRSIDVLLLTHPHADHIDGALEVLKRYKVGMIIESSVNHSIPEYSEWHNLIAKKNIPIHYAKAGEIVGLGGGVHFDFYYPNKTFLGESPKNIHDAMVVGRLVFASSSMMFMGDAEAPIEYRLLSGGFELYSDVLKVGHHGSKTSSSEEFLQAVSPTFAVISVGKKNRYGHPHQDVLDRLQAIGIKIFRTDRDGDVIFKSTGRRFVPVSE